MVPVMSLWMPILLSAVIVFIVSSVIHMATPWHKGDYKKIPREDEAMDALRAINIPPGDYMTPRPGSMKEMGSAEFMAKREKGPVFLMTMFPKVPFSMAGNMIGWFIFSVVVSFFTAYVAGVALPTGTDYLKVFQIVGTVSFMGYSLGQAPQSIWYRKDWGTTIRSMIDGLIYGLMTAGTFGWLWPR